MTFGLWMCFIWYWFVFPGNVLVPLLFAFDLADGNFDSVCEVHGMVGEIADK